MVSKEQAAPGTAATADAEIATAKTVARTTTSIAPAPLRPPHTPAAEPAPNCAFVRLCHTKLSSSDIDFTDNFFKPNYTANVTGMNGSIASDKL